VTRVVSIGDIADVFNGKTPAKTDQRDAGYPVMKIKDVDAFGFFRGNFGSFVDYKFADKFRAKHLQQGDLLILNAAHNAEYVASKTFYASHDYGCPLVTGEWTVVRSKKGLADAGYVRRYIESVEAKRLIKEMVSGIHLYPKDVSRCPIPLPPVDEQRRIAAILDKADALRAKRREAIVKLDQLLQSVFLDMFGDPVVNSKKWPVVKFGDVTNSRLGKMLDKRTSQGPDMKPYLANLNVQWGRFELGSLRTMNFDRDDQHEFSLHDGDLLMCEGGEPGRCAIWRSQIEDCYYQKALHRVRCHSGKTVPEYIQWLFWFLAKAGAFQSSIASATIAHLPGVKLKNMCIPAPPVELQKVFAKKIYEISSLASQHNASAKALDETFASLQQQVFSGTL
jgi:type I restriction enzyme, S subunit